ncbi:MAG TPA: class I lanthipeptide [Thermoanaerobaculia bacterium]|nr:class I lanthipeptide [Thermoanaerobaculia bacterium]
MKKKVKKLELNKETVRNLTNEDLKKVAGGSTSECTFPRTCCLSCRDFCC